MEWSGEQISQPQSPYAVWLCSPWAELNGMIEIGNHLCTASKGDWLIAGISQVSPWKRAIRQDVGRMACLWCIYQDFNNPTVIILVAEVARQSHFYFSFLSPPHRRSCLTFSCIHTMNFTHATMSSFSHWSSAQRPPPSSVMKQWWPQSCAVTTARVTLRVWWLSCPDDIICFTSRILCHPALFPPPQPRCSMNFGGGAMLTGA